uniref:Uncharacterized protein n=1 Tax=Lotus japonicus TaxID=34305 RepID=I3S8Y7_LOTJA|nr:unknown [Lotus japonicus]
MKKQGIRKTNKLVLPGERGFRLCDSLPSHQHQVPLPTLVNPLACCNDCSVLDHGLLRYAGSK